MPNIKSAKKRVKTDAVKKEQTNLPVPTSVKSSAEQTETKTETVAE